MATVEPVVAAGPPVVCPRCRGRLLRNAHGRECLVHGEVWAEPQAWERAPSDRSPSTRGRSWEVVHLPQLPVTDAERELWRRAEAGEHIPAPADPLEEQERRREQRDAERSAAALELRRQGRTPGEVAEELGVSRRSVFRLQEGKPVAELVIQKADDLAEPVVARCRDMAQRIASAQAAIRGIQEEGLRLLQVADLLKAPVPDEVRVILTGKAKPGPKPAAPASAGPASAAAREYAPARLSVCPHCGEEKDSRHQQWCLKNPSSRRTSLRKEDA